MRAIQTAAIIGLGEAGQVFAAGFRNAGLNVRAFDSAAASAPEVFGDRADRAGATLASSRGDALAGADFVVSLVTADQSVTAAKECAPFLDAGQFYLDLNSCSPRAKRAAAGAVSPAGAVFVEGVAMDTVPLKGFAVPLLLAAPEASGLAAQLTSFGMRVEVVGAELGAAASVKLIRSVIIKGMEALFAEAMEAGAALGVEGRILASLHETFPGLAWERVAGYHLSRLAVHGRRRAAEMRESAVTLRDLDVEPVMALAAAQRHQMSADIGLGRYISIGDDPTVEDFVDALRAAAKSSTPS